MTVAAVWTNVHAPTKVALHDGRVVGLSDAGATVISEPVPVPLATLAIATGITRVPDVDVGAKFSLGVPFAVQSECFFVKQRPPSL